MNYYFLQTIIYKVSPIKYHMRWILQIIYKIIKWEIELNFEEKWFKKKNNIFIIEIEKIIAKG